MRAQRRTPRPVLPGSVTAGSLASPPSLPLNRRSPANPLSLHNLSEQSSGFRQTKLTFHEIPASEGVGGGTLQGGKAPRMQGGYKGYPTHQNPSYTQQYAAPPGHPGAYNVSLCVVMHARARASEGGMESDRPGNSPTLSYALLVRERQRERARARVRVGGGEDPACFSGWG